MLLEMADFTFNNLFYYERDLFHQIRKTAMSSPFVTSHASLFMCWSEREQLFCSHLQIYEYQMLLWLRFLYDIFILWNGKRNS